MSNKDYMKSKMRGQLTKKTKQKYQCKYKFEGLFDAQKASPFPSMFDSRPVDGRRWKIGYIMSWGEVSGFGKKMLSRILIEFSFMCASQSRVAENCQSSFFLSRTVEDIQAARIRKANAEFLKAIRSISRALETIWRVNLIEDVHFERIERL